MRLQGEPSWPRAPTQSPQRVPGAEEVPLALHDKEPYIGLCSAKVISGAEVGGQTNWWRGNPVAFRDRRLIGAL